MNTPKDPIGQEIKTLRKKRDLSVPELSAILDIPKDRIYKWEKGSSPKYADRTLIAKWKADPEWRNVPHESSVVLEERPEVLQTKTVGTGDILQMIHGLLQTQNKILERQEKSIVSKVSEIEINLNTIAGKAEALQYDLVSGREVVLQSLARLEGLKDEDLLLIEADKRKKFLAETKAGLHMKTAAGRRNRR